MLHRLTQKLEDPKRPLLGPNLKALRFFGVLLPDNFCAKYLFVFFNLMVVVFIATEYIDIWLTRSELDHVLVNLKSSMSSTFNGFKVVTMYIWQTRWKHIIAYVTRADVELRKSTDPHNTEYCRRITYTYWVLIFITGFTVILHPLFKYITQPTYRYMVHNGTELGLAVVPSWVPWDKSKFSGYIAASLYQSYATIFGIGWISSFDTFAIVILVFFRVELEVLRNDCGYIFGTEDAPVDEVETCRRIKQCHKRYIDLLKYTRLYNACMSPVMLLYMFVCTIMLCVTAYQFTEESSALKGMLTWYMIKYSFVLLIVSSSNSNKYLALLSKDLMLGPYESRWWSSRVPRQRDICILIHQFRESIVFTAGPFTDLTITTFLNIIKGAYSYYTILKQSKNQ
nr:odorant receptor [Papilio glaucus]